MTVHVRHICRTQLICVSCIQSKFCSFEFHLKWKPHLGTMDYRACIVSFIASWSCLGLLHSPTRCGFLSLIQRGLSRLFHLSLLDSATLPSRVPLVRTDISIWIFLSWRFLMARPLKKPMAPPPMAAAAPTFIPARKPTGPPHIPPIMAPPIGSMAALYVDACFKQRLSDLKKWFSRQHHWNQ